MQSQYKSTFVKLIKAIKDKDESAIVRIIDNISNNKINNTIWKLGRYRYKKYPLTISTINKLKRKKSEKYSNVRSWLYYYYTT